MSWHHRSGIMIGLLTVAGMAAPGSAQAHSWHRHGTPWARSRIVVLLPRGATPLRFGDDSYYYCRGRYYKHGSRGYRVVPAPAGAIVPALPEEHRTIVIDGITYHAYDGVYYRGGPAGYTIVPIARTAPDSDPTPTNGQSAPAATQNATIINVPNKNGSYTPVTLQLAGTGMYIGPQGEIYPNLPTAQQFQTMYGK